MARSEGARLAGSRGGRLPRHGRGLPDEADRAYERAADLWRKLGRLGAEVRATRARAWLASQRPVAGWPAVLALMDAATDLLAPAGSHPPATGGSDSAEIVYERAETLRQTAELLLRWPREEGPAELRCAG